MQTYVAVPTQGFLAFERTVDVFRRLCDLETQTLNTIARLEQQRLLAGPQGNGASINHPADLSYREPIDDVTLEMNRMKLNVIARARKKLLVERTYGACDDCASEIPAERLDVRPDAVRCCGCQARLESKSGSKTRSRYRPH